ncbi:hypothetical protein E6C60_1385 [Paenibacillus algicola]|uniref:Uncharacterized protein n=1 Tax=Paenibacillus algicola TaxID=2565926 RepID=A0A4P8XKX2_9BACL|nr:hypothetical protein [Paenibacillus algicola]QCT02101.1 hypothetical protein E6C60_1385 [Paenibacillus algicola]
MYLVMQGINVNKSEVVQKVHNVSEPLEKLFDAELDAELESLKNEVMGGNVVKFHNSRKNATNPPMIGGSYSNYGKAVLC